MASDQTVHDPFERAAARDRQRRFARTKRGFVIHLAVFVAVQALLIAAWALTDGDFPWFVFPLLGWGIGLAAHAAAVYARPAH